MTTEYIPFDASMRIDHNTVTPEVLASLSPEQGEALALLVDADLAVQSAEQAVIDIRKRVLDLSADHDAKLAAFHAASPVVNQAVLIKEAVAVANGWRSPTPTLADLTKSHADLQTKAKASHEKIKAGKGDPAAHKALMTDLAGARARMDAEAKRLTAKAAYDEANEALAAARAEQIRIIADVRPARAKFSEALVRWQSFTKKLTQLDLARDAARRSAEAALAEAAKNPQVGPRQWPLERALQSKKEVAKSTRRNFV